MVLAWVYCCQSSFCNTRIPRRKKPRELGKGIWAQNIVAQVQRIFFFLYLLHSLSVFSCSIPHFCSYTLVLFLYKYLERPGLISSSFFFFKGFSICFSALNEVLRLLDLFPGCLSNFLSKFGHTHDCFLVIYPHCYFLEPAKLPF